MRYPVTPDGRYFVVRGRLWRCTDPSLDEETRQEQTRRLMKARRERNHDEVQAAKETLGERGPVWWTDGAPDVNRHMAKNTDYADWYAALSPGERGD